MSEVLCRIGLGLVAAWTAVSAVDGEDEWCG